MNESLYNKFGCGHSLAREDYHWRREVSLHGSKWDVVGPSRYDNQTNNIQHGSVLLTDMILGVI